MSAASSGRATVRRIFLARNRSRQALTTIRCSQVRDLGGATERVGPAVGRDQGVLHGIGGVVGVAAGAQRHRPQPVLVSAHQFGERVRVAGDVGREQLLIGDVRQLDPSAAERSDIAP